MNDAPVQRRLMEFIRENFGGNYSVSKLTGDASDRQYFRYSEEPAQSFILAAYPAPFDPQHFPYTQMAQLLDDIHISIPKVLKVDGPRGIVLQQDLGDQSLQKWLRQASPDARMPKLQEAVDLIVRIQEDGSPRLTSTMEAYHLAFDREKLIWELGFFRHHYLEGYRALQIDRTALEEEFSDISSALADRPRVLCHRDFHVRNLMVLEGALFVIDFQDARWGPRSYDLASLLQDSLALEVSEREALVQHYLRRVTSLDSEDFWREFHLMTIQRLLKALGTFAYQARVRGNFIYEQYMPGSLQRALRAVHATGRYPVLKGILEVEVESERS